MRPDLTASLFKPHMGSSLYRLNFGGRDYDATALSALVLGRLKADAEGRLGERCTQAVITVPAYFADPQRKATIEAGRMAGLKVSADHQRADGGGPGLWAAACGGG